LPYGFSHWDKLPTEIKDIITSYATGQLIHDRRQNKEATDLIKEMDLYSSMRMLWRRFGHARITYIKCYKHSFKFPFNSPPCYVSHNKIYVNYKKTYYCYINYIGEYLDSKTKRKCEMVIGRVCIRSSLFNIQEKIKKATSTAIDNKCVDHKHCLCF
jgi:hypothetical protein